MPFKLKDWKRPSDVLGWLSLIFAWLSLFFAWLVLISVIYFQLLKGWTLPVVGVLDLLILFPALLFWLFKYWKLSTRLSVWLLFIFGCLILISVIYFWLFKGWTPSVVGVLDFLILLSVLQFWLIKGWTLPTNVFGWLILISVLHFWLNFDHGSRQIVSMGYMPVITNMAAPLLDYVSKDKGDIYFKALKFSSFAEMAEALRNDEIQAAFIIAPLSIVLRQQGEGVKIVYIGNRHESSLVARKDLRINDQDSIAGRLRSLTGKKVAVPMRFSGHNLSLRELMDKYGLTGQINIVEMNPPDMASALASKSDLAAYYVGEPFASKTLQSGFSDLVLHVEEVWPSFICNLMLVKQSTIDRDPEAVRRLVQGAARSGLWAEKHQDEAAAIAAQYWSQPVDLVKYALDGRKVIFDQFLPKEQEMQQIADLMVKHGLIEKNNIDGLVDAQFAAVVKKEQIDRLEDILP